jgi:hypothetical protein
MSGLDRQCHWLRYERRNIPAETLAVMTEIVPAAARISALPPCAWRTRSLPRRPAGLPLRVGPLRASFDAVVAAERASWSSSCEESRSAARRRVSTRFRRREGLFLFDGDDRSLVRTERANPVVVVVDFSRPRPLRELALTIGSMQCEVNVAVSGPSGEASVSQTHRDLPRDPTITVELPDIGGPVSTVRIEVRDVNADEPQHVHLREARLR